MKRLIQKEVLINLLLGRLALSHLRLLGSLSVASYDSQGLRWKYSYPPPHGESAESCDRYSSHVLFFLEMNTTMETIVEEEDIIYQKDASFSAELDTSDDVRGNSVLSPPTVDEVEKKVRFLTTQSPNLEQKVPGSSAPSDGHTTESLHAADATPCLLDCGVGGSCAIDHVDPSRPGQQRCQCPLGRGGNHCEMGKFRNKCCYNCFCECR
jgi:hypothetical protein